MCTEQFKLNQENYSEDNSLYANNLPMRLLNSNRTVFSYGQIMLIASMKSIDRRLQTLNKTIKDKKNKEIKILKWCHIAILMDRLYFYIALAYFAIGFSHFLHAHEMHEI